MIPSFNFRPTPAAQPPAPVRTGQEAVVVGPVPATAPAPFQHDRLELGSPGWVPSAEPLHFPKVTLTTRGVLHIAKKRLEARARAAESALKGMFLTPDQRKAYAAELAGAKRELALVERLGAALTRAERNPATSASDLGRLRELVEAATAIKGTTFAERRRAVLEAERLAEVIGRPAGAGRALDEAVVRLRERKAELEDEVAALKAKGATGSGLSWADHELRDACGRLEATKRALGAVEAFAERSHLHPDRLASIQKLVDEIIGTSSYSKAWWVQDTLSRMVANEGTGSGGSGGGTRRTVYPK